MKRRILGLALAGGESRRLGRDKVQLSFRDGISQLDYTLRLLGAFCDRLAISAREDQRNERRSSISAEYIVDVEGLRGPLAGVLAGLRVAQGPLLAVACDMPLLDAGVLLKLLCRRAPDKLASCYTAADGKAEPMCAVYEAKALPVLEARVKSGKHSLRDFLEEADVERISLESPQLLASVNTLEDIDTVREWLTR